MNLWMKQNFEKQFPENGLEGIFLSESKQKEIEKEKIHIQLKDLGDVNHSYAPTISIGEGLYSNVVLVKNWKTGVSYAMKKIKSTYLDCEEVKKYFINEVSIHQRLIHPNIIKVEEVLKDKNDYLLLLEYAEGGNLENYIRNQRKLNIDEALFFFIQICNALKFLHSSNIIHRDIKSRNVLITKERIIKLCDFGWASILQRKEKFA